jgi:hypothetical protein
LAKLELESAKISGSYALAETLKNHGKFSGPNFALKFRGLLPQEVI